MLRCWICTVIGAYLTLSLLVFTSPATGEPGHAVGTSKVGGSIKERISATSTDSSPEAGHLRWTTWAIFLDHYLKEGKGQALKNEGVPEIMRGKDAVGKIERYIAEDVRKWDARAEILKQQPSLKENPKLLDQTVERWKTSRATARRAQFDALYRDWLWNIGERITLDEWMRLDLTQPQVHAVLSQDPSPIPRSAINRIISLAYTRWERTPASTVANVAQRRRLERAIREATRLYEQRRG